MVEAIGDQYDPETSEAIEVGLKAIATVDKSAIVGPSGSSEVADGGSSENSSSEGNDCLSNHAIDLIFLVPERLYVMK